MSPRREYSGTSVSTTLASDITSSATTIPLAAVTGWPTGPDPAFAVIRSGSNEEKITYTGISGTSLTGVTRAQDGTSAAAWSTGATVEHVWTATDAEEANAHIFDTTRDDHNQYIKKDGTRAFTGTGSIAGTPAVVLGTANAPGSANTLLRSDATLLAFDTTVPARDGTAATGSATVAARRDHVHPGATLGYAQVTSSQGSITTATDLTGLSVAVTVVSGHRIKITAYTRPSSTDAADTVQLQIKEGATVLNYAEREMVNPLTGDTLVAYAILTPTAGAHTYKLTMLRAAGTGTVTNNALATNPSFILVEDVGV